jgi:DNA-binding NarL/FixJ family response regulator
LLPASRYLIVERLAVSPLRRSPLALKIVLVEDQPVPGLTLRRWLRKQRDLQVVGEAVPGSPVLALIPLVEPDAILLDVQTSPEAGLNVARMIRDHFPNVPIVAIGEAGAGNLRVEAAEAGAWAFFSRTKPEDLAKAIPSVIEGKGKPFVDLSSRTFQRPPPDSFVALPEEKTRRKAPEPSPITVQVATPAAPAPAPAAAPKAAPPAAPRVPARAAPKAAAAPAAAPKTLAPKLPAAPALDGSAPAPAVAPARAPKVSPAAAPKPAAKAAPSTAPPERTRRERPAPAATSPQSPFELVPPSRWVGPREAVAWTHSALEPVLDPPSQKKPRRRRGKKEEEEVPVETDVRGQFGLPRRYGGHR